MQQIKDVQPRKAQMLVFIETQDKTASGIILPDTAHKDYRVAVVQAVGPEVNSTLGSDGKYHEKPAEHQLKPGDRVVINTYGGTKLKVGDKEFVLTPSDAAFAIVS